jgi:hypothetical protein
MFEHGYAVIIGVDENQIPRLALPTVASDVTAVYDVLIHPDRCAYNPDNVRLLKGDESTQRNILDALFWLNEKVKADPEATAVIYYSGHGMEDPAANRYYLVPYDISDLARIRTLAIPAETFNGEIAAIQARRMLVLLDCCHAAGMQVKNIEQNSQPTPSPAAFPIDLPQTKDIPAFSAEPGQPVSKAVSDLIDGEGRAILNSSTGSQSSWTRGDGRMSIFTYHLIEALTGHAPHPDDATVVYVTDVMSWVTHQVKKSAAREGVEQTPVMRTSGVFPVAQLIGGQGLPLSKGTPAPDPLAPLPQTGPNYQIGGDYVGGDKIGGDKVMGDQISGNKYEGITISGSPGSAISFGQGSPVSVGTNYQSQGGGDGLSAVFAPLEALINQQAPALSTKVDALKDEVQRRSQADDSTVADLIRELVQGLPAAKTAVTSLFKDPTVAKSAGPNTKFIISLFD